VVLRTEKSVVVMREGISVCVCVSGLRTEKSVAMMREGISVCVCVSGAKNIKECGRDERRN
jgi:hypothetical protein